MRPSRFFKSANRRRTSGFTLLELVAVVAIISIFAALAIPATVAQLRNRRLHQSAREVAIVYRQARMKAMGRGSAVLVRYENNSLQVMEATRTNLLGGCSSVPFSQCRGNTWNDPAQTRQLGGFAPPSSDLNFTVLDSASISVSTLDICFSPMGRAFVREIITDAQPFTALREAYIARLSQSDVFLPRLVVLMPNGSARLMALEAP